MTFKISLSNYRLILQAQRQSRIRRRVGVSTHVAAVAMSGPVQGSEISASMATKPTASKSSVTPTILLQLCRMKNELPVYFISLYT